MTDYRDPDPADYALVWWGLVAGAILAAIMIITN